MEIDPNDSERGINDYSIGSKKPLEKGKSQDFVELLKSSGSTLSDKELQDVFNKLVQKLSGEVDKAKTQYLSLQEEYQKAIAQPILLSRNDLKNLKRRYLEQLNGVIGSLRETLEKAAHQSLSSAHVGEQQPSDDMVHQLLQTINDPTTKEAYTAKFVKDPETPFLSSAKKERSFESLIKETDSKMTHFTQTAPSTPQPPISIQELESQLSQLATSGPDRNTQVLASVVLGEIKTLDGKGLSLTTIESWAYAAIIGKMTTNSEYSTGFANLNPSEQTLFKTITGIDHFQEQFSSHPFTTDQVTEIAKTFSNETIALQNANDQKFMQAFYTNLEAGQNPKTAEQNAYTTVPRSSLSPAMQTFITGIVNPNPPPFNPHTPTSIQDLESQLSQLASSGPDRNIQVLASVVLGEVKTLDGKGLSLTTIESWAYAAIVGKMTSNSEYSTGFANLTPTEQGLFKTLTGIDQFQGKFSSHSFTTTQVTEIAKTFSDGTITLQNVNDQKFMQAFYTNLQAGQDPKTAVKNAYTTVPRSSLSPAMQTFITGIVNPNTPPPFTPHPPTSISDLENELNQFASLSDPNVKALAATVMAQVKALADKGISLTSIESWAYASIIGQVTEDSKYSIGFENINPTEQDIFKTLMGIDAFEGKLSSHSFSPSDVKAIAKSFSDGTIPLKNSHATSFMEDFYTNLNNGQDLKTAAQNAYGKVPASELSAAMNVFIQGLSNYSPAPPPVYPAPPTTLPPGAPPGTVPFVITVPPGKKLGDVYIGVQLGVDTKHGQNDPAIYKIPKNGLLSNNDKVTWTAGGADMSQYRIPLSDLPNNGRTATIYIPPGYSGRIYMSLGKPLQWAAPSRTNSGDPDNNINWSVMEYTNTGTGFNLDETAVNSYSSPSMSTRLFKDGVSSGVTMGTRTLPSDIISKAKEVFKQACAGNAEALRIWNSLFQQQAGLPYIAAPKNDLNTFGPYFDPYIQNRLIPYLEKNPLYLDINGTEMKVTATSDGKTFEIYTFSGQLMGTFPVSQFSTMNWLSGGDVPKIPGVPADEFTQGLSALLMSGLDLNTLKTSTASPLSNAVFAQDYNSGKFFKATYNGMPMWDVYDQALHEAGYESYAYDYDDLFGISGDAGAAASEKPGFSILLNF